MAAGTLQEQKTNAGQASPPQPNLPAQATYLTLVGTFTGLLATFSSLKQQQKALEELKPLDFALLGLATYRTGRLIAFDKVTQPIRNPFAQTKPDKFKAGDTVEPRGSGVQKAIGELIACPTCAGTWVAAGLVYGLAIAPKPTRLFLTIMAASGMGEILNTSVEWLNWNAQQARKHTGQAQG